MIKMAGKTIFFLFTLLKTKEKKTLQEKLSLYWIFLKALEEFLKWQWSFQRS